MKNLITVIVLVILIVAGFWFWNSSDKQLDVSTNFEIDSERVTTENSIASDGSFKDPGGRLHFSVPVDAKISGFDQGEGRVILVKRGEQNIQITETPFDEDVAITPERILKDVPDMIISSPKGLEVEGKLRGTVFDSKEDDFITKEIWFSYTGFIYQISADSASITLLEEIFATWAFKN